MEQGDLKFSPDKLANLEQALLRARAIQCAMECAHSIMVTDGCSANEAFNKTVGLRSVRSSFGKFPGSCYSDFAIQWRAFVNQA